MRIARPNFSLGGWAGMAGSDRRQAFTALATAVGQGGATALGALAGQEPMLTDPATFGRLILSFHKSNCIQKAQ
jgi:hypothetical protein